MVKSTGINIEMREVIKNIRGGSMKIRKVSLKFREVNIKSRGVSMCLRKLLVNNVPTIMVMIVY